MTITKLVNIQLLTLVTAVGLSACSTQQVARNAISVAKLPVKAAGAAGRAAGGVVGGAVGGAVAGSIGRSVGRATGRAVGGAAAGGQ